MNDGLYEVLELSEGPISTLINSVQVSVNGILRYQDYTGSDLWKRCKKDMLHITDDYIQITEWFDLLNLADIKNEERPLYNAELISLNFKLNDILTNVKASFYTTPIIETYERVHEMVIPKSIDYAVTNSTIFTTHKACCTGIIVLEENSKLQQIMIGFQQNGENVDVDLSKITLVLGLDEYNLENSPFHILTDEELIIINLDREYTKDKRCLQVQTDDIYDVMWVALEQRQILTLSSQGKSNLKPDIDDGSTQNQSSSENSNSDIVIVI